MLHLGKEKLTLRIYQVKMKSTWCRLSGIFIKYIKEDVQDTYDIEKDEIMMNVAKQGVDKINHLGKLLAYSFDS
jgi:hypothetical protein